MLRTYATQGALALERATLAQAETKARILEESDRLKSALLSSVSHELRTPLATIKASVTSLLAGDVDWETQARQDLETVNEETDHLNRLVGNLLDMSRIEAGALNPVRQWNVLTEILESALQRIHRTAQDYRIETDIPDDLPLIPVDFLQIERVFVNLVSNSTKYAPVGTMIQITARVEEPDAIFVQVTNQGPPVPQEHLERIFDKFYRVTDAERVTGTGLGLSICRRIICFIPPSPNALVVRWQLAGWNARTQTGLDLPPVRFSLYRWADPTLEALGERFAGDHLHDAFKGMGLPKVTPLAPPTARKEGDLSWIEQAFPPDPLFKDGFRCQLAPWATDCRISPVGMKSSGEARLQILPAVTATNGTLSVGVATSSDRGGPREELQRTGKAVTANTAEAVERWSEATRRSAAEFWSRSRLHVDDPLIENCWYETLHARRCAYRHDTVPPGLFLPSTVQDYSHWHGDYHLNYNFQEPFWGDYTANQIALGDAYFKGIVYSLLRNPPTSYF